MNGLDFSEVTCVCIKANTLYSGVRAARAARPF